MTALRFDIGGLRRSHRTDEGYLVCDAIVSRTGVFPYRNPDGSTRHEARLREDVFDRESLASLAGKPVVLMHPRQDGEDVMVTPDNVARYQVGTVGTELVELAGGHVKAQLIIHRRDAIEAIETGVRGVSPGYRVREDRVPGHAFGQRYDLAQRAIRYNHVAIVPLGRQGTTLRADEDAAYSTRLDSLDVEPFPLTTPAASEPAMKVKIKVDGAEYEVDGDVAPLITTLQQRADALETAVEGHKTRADQAAANLATVTAERDAAKGELATLKATPRNDSDADRLAWAKERAELLGVAKVLKVDVAEAASNAEIKRAVVASRVDALPADASAEYVDGCWRGIVAGIPKSERNDELEKAFAPPSSTTKPAASTDFGARYDSAKTTYEKNLTGAGAE